MNSDQWEDGGVILGVDPDVLGDAVALDDEEAGGVVGEVLDAGREDREGEDDGRHGGWYGGWYGD